MALSPKLELRQSQTLVMTPQLMQAIKLLQLSSLDLAAYVADELERNPLLESEDSGAEEPAAEAEPAAKSDEDWFEAEGAPSRDALEGTLDTDLSNVYPDERQEEPAPRAQEASGDSYTASPMSGMGADGENLLENMAGSTATLTDYMKAQLMLSGASPRAQLIGAALIDGLDDTGYFTDTVEAVAERLGVTAEETEAVLKIIQGFDPSGVGARNLQECLAIQLCDLNRLDPAMEALLANLDLLARRDMPALRRVCGVDDEDLAEMISEVRHLSPKPGLVFGFEPIRPVVPDVIISAGPDGAWRIELNPETMPRVLVNQTYYATVSRQAKSADEKNFLAECLQNANWLTRSLEQRARTILKVASEIARQQDGFLMDGIEYLRPLNLRTVADAIGMHESTVSRVTANKYVATPRGIFELKYFFGTALSAADGGSAHSAETVRHRIRQMIDAEASPQAVLSDDDIVQRLQNAGIEIARRTVAKYRESMRIPSSVQRRREKKVTFAG